MCVVVEILWWWHCFLWSHVTAVVTCFRFNVANGNVSMTSYAYGSLAEVTCWPGYRIGDSSRTSAVVTCSADGQWQPSNVTCRRMYQWHLYGDYTGTRGFTVLCALDYNIGQEIAWNRRRNLVGSPLWKQELQEDDLHIIPKTQDERIYIKYILQRVFLPADLIVNYQAWQTVVVRPCLPTRCAAESHHTAGNTGSGRRRGRPRKSCKDNIKSRQASRCCPCCTLDKTEAEGQPSLPPKQRLGVTGIL